MKRTVFFISDHTGLTAEAMGRALLSQFDGLEYDTVHWPFLDSREKAERAVRKINRSAVADGMRPLVFSSFVDREIRLRLQESSGLVFDFFATYTATLEQELQMAPSSVRGRFHGMGKRSLYDERIRAVNFALANDDGTLIRNYDAADLILVGVSRSGKTPTCLYLGLQFGILAANYPITEGDLERNAASHSFLQHQEKLFGLTIDPIQLQRIRKERRPGGRYSRLDQCKWEVREAEALLQCHAIPYIDTTSMSVEEISATILQRTGLESRIGR